ncbi:AAA domain-containing protein [Myxococcus sp. K38C18041901]|uniref:AAA domain-containing protein n=1 Tax=Myxococcus guangdongensis TaxID=2906760 RepID=UPI0020A754E2|nr:AAA domain-containing protein [Myxococcus guangdongensis]MCP3065492.1 AAA domain-containing protein [Myxococcus guangdongensis]
MSSEPRNRVLEKMLERLYAALASGPSLNCRPHHSRQRLDLATLTRLDGTAPHAVLASLLGDKATVRLAVKPPESKGRLTAPGGTRATSARLAAEARDASSAPPRAARVSTRPQDDASDELTTPVEEASAPDAIGASNALAASTRPTVDESAPALINDERASEAEGPDDRASPTRAEEEQQALLRKLAAIVEDARIFEQDTGAHVLHVGFPLLQLPPGPKDKRGFGTRRILAPIAFVPVRITLKKGRTPSVELEGAEDGVDRVAPNTALLAWLEQQTGQRFNALFADETGEDPWREVNELVALVSKALELPTPEPFTSQAPLSAVPRPDEDSASRASILPSAVLGLYPLSNQSLVDDMRALVDGEPVDGPLESFLRVDVSLDPPAHPGGGERNLEGLKRAEDERLVTIADPCQARAVRLARSRRGLVIHGPPGTGKSQTIANAIGDHLARGERVLFVCDKRTALDVVKHRLDHLGLGNLCAVVHDAQRDQRDLYMGIREQLDTLAETRTDAAVPRELSRVDTELQSLHDELTTAEHALSARPEDGSAPSFHELVGQWLGLEPPAALTPATASLTSARLADVSIRERETREVFERALKEDYPDNPWREALGVDLATYLATPLTTWRERLGATVEAARDADALASPDIPAFGAEPEAEGLARAHFAEQLAPVLETTSPESLARWASASADTVHNTKAQLEGLSPQIQVLSEGPLDTELALIHREQPQALGALSTALATLGAYLGIARKWYAFFCFARKAGARKVLQQFGLTLGAATAERVRHFLTGARARALLGEFHRATLVPSATSASLPDETLSRDLRAHAALFEVLGTLDSTPRLASCRDAVRRALTTDAATRTTLLAGLRRSAARGAAVAKLEKRLAETGLCSSEWLALRAHELRAGALFTPVATALQSRGSTVEGMLRLRSLLSGMPPELAASVESLARLGADAETGWTAVLKATLAAEVTTRLREDPTLQHVDAERTQATQARYRVLEEKKRGLVRDAILHRWTQRQRERLLAANGGRLNSQGAELRRRLMLRGERAMRVRQVIATGLDIDGGDPLFDARPVWMASPQTVAQIFPRRPIFDVVIFDESSQCRLEEALPVLTRARRVVIAGDPKQLPPTRFFESAVVQSQQDSEAETEQGLFEEQQSEVEDLLSAALNLDIDQCYLDVHYRSRDADLIAFSNEHFYDKRLQAIPAHPSHRAPHAALRLLPVGGTYEKRVNLVEARAVGQLVKELLARPEPPSIGIACFNLSQRDAITDVLDELAAEDAAFSTRLAAARTRRGAGSFEGLFVKNLENVQGDERDHLIISTTYGPDRQGRFYRRFGPLGSSGGGRRLNVLVTRARQQVHLVTSIPRDAYTALPPVEPGRQPNGGWLLFAYLQFAESISQPQRAPTPEAATRELIVHERETDAGSTFARALAHHLARRHQVSSDVHWGNDGFCVDVALHHPTSPGDVTVGLLCDGTRYPKAADRVEWDLFRTGVLEGQGWKLVRLWTPHFFRDPEGATTQVLQRVGEVLMRQPAPPTVDAPDKRALH